MVVLVLDVVVDFVLEPELLVEEYVVLDVAEELVAEEDETEVLVLAEDELERAVEVEEVEDEVEEAELPLVDATEIDAVEATVFNTVVVETTVEVTVDCATDKGETTDVASAEEDAAELVRLAVIVVCVSACPCRADQADVIAKVDAIIRKMGTHSNRPVTSKSGRPPRTLDALRFALRSSRSILPSRMAR